MSKEFLIRAFPTLLIIEDLCAGLICAYFRDKNMTVYWIAAAILTASVTYKF